MFNVMAGRAKEAIIPFVRSLITQLTAFEEGEENFELCERYALSNLWHHRFLSVDSHAVRRSVDGIITKFEVHGHLDTATKFRQLIDKLLSSEVFNDHPQYDIQWSLLSLLLNLAINPTSTAHHVEAAPVIEETSCEDDGFDWTSYLREGDERFICPCDDFLSDEWNSDSDESSNELAVASVIHAAAAVPLETESRKEGLIQNLRDIYLAEEWLDANVQHMWTQKNALKDSNTLSKYPSANLANLWKDHLAEQGNENENFNHIISEYKMLRQILFMFYTTSSTQLFEVSNNRIAVKPGITVCSLTKNTVVSYLSDLCHYFKMLRELRCFGEDLSESEILPPLTYLTYWNEVKEFLSNLNNFLIEIERKVRKQDGICTLLWLKNELEPKLSELRCVYCVHIRAVYDWKTSSNWLSAISLLSVLYDELLNESNNNHAPLILRLFLKSFQVYLNIIDTWLTDGELVDPREEFVISKDCEIHPYQTMLHKAGIEPLPVLKLVISKVLNSVSSFELLLRLNKLPEFNKSQGSLYEELVESVTDALMKFVNSPQLPKVDNNKFDHVKKEESTFFAEVKDHVLYFADPFLLKAFESYLPLNNNEEKDEYMSLKTTKQSFTRIQHCFAHEMLPLKPVIERNLIQLVDKKCKAACYLVKPLFQNEFNLSKHFQVIRGVFLMEAGDIMHVFYTSLFHQIEMYEASSFSLSIHLRSCIDILYPEFSSYFSVVVDKSLQTATSVQDAINSIKLRYTVDWPVSLILTEQNMDLYNIVFQFLLKIKWAIFSLQKLRFTDLEQKQLKKKERMRAHKLQILRFWLLHSVNSIHNYLMGQVLHSLEVELHNSIQEADNLDSLVNAHAKYIKMVYIHCLQTPEQELLRKPVLRMTWTALRLCEVWEAGVIALSDARLSELEDLYCKSYIFLAIVLSNWVEIDTISQCYVAITEPLLSNQVKYYLQFVLGELGWQSGSPSELPVPLPDFLLRNLMPIMWNRINK